MRVLNISEKEKGKKLQYYSECIKNLFEDQKQRLRRNYYIKHTK